MTNEYGPEALIVYRNLHLRSRHLASDSQFFLHAQVFEFLRLEVCFTNGRMTHWTWFRTKRKDAIHA